MNCKKKKKRQVFSIFNELLEGDTLWRKVQKRKININRNLPINLFFYLTFCFAQRPLFFVFFLASFMTICWMPLSSSSHWSWFDIATMTKYGKIKKIKKRACTDSHFCFLICIKKKKEYNLQYIWFLFSTLVSQS